MGNPSNSLEFAMRQFRSTVLTNAALTVSESARPIFGFKITGGAAAEVVIFRGFGAGATYFQVPVGIAGYVTDNLRWRAYNGLEVLTATLAGDVTIEVFYT